MNTLKRGLRKIGDDGDGGGLRQPQKKNTGDGTNCKGSIDFQVFINDIGMLKLKDKVAASTSIALTKAQRTRMGRTLQTEDQNNQKKIVSELHKHLLMQ